MGCGATTANRSKYTVVHLDPGQHGPDDNPRGAVSSTAPADQDCPSALRVGAAVRLRHLKAQPWLNDALATCVSFDASTNRWTVRLECGDEKAVKADNLAAATLCVGAHVRIWGLKSDSALNGMVGTLESYDAESNRWTVCMSGGVKKALKGQNLLALHGMQAGSESRGPACDLGACDALSIGDRDHPRGPFQELQSSPLYEALSKGHVRLVRGSYFQRRAAEGLPWQRRAEVSDCDLWSPEVAVKHWADFGPGFFLALSYPWLSREHSDPELWHLRRLAWIIAEWRGALSSTPFFEHVIPPLSGSDMTTKALADVGVFVDFISIGQKSKQGTSSEELQYQEAMKVMALVYGHRDTSVLRFTMVPPRIERKYGHRGWTGFESCISNNKAFADGKVFDFGELFQPEHEVATKAAFLKKYKVKQVPPCSAERFQEMLYLCEEDVKKLRVPYDRLFTDPSDKPIVVKKFKDAWEEQRMFRELDFNGAGWENVEALQLASVLPHFAKLEVVRLSGNRIGDQGAEAIVAAIADCPVKLIDISDNCVSTAGADGMAAGLPLSRHLAWFYGFANPFCGSDEARWRLTTAWVAAGRSKENLVLDHFALKHRKL